MPGSANLWTQTSVSQNCACGNCSWCCLLQKLQGIAIIVSHHQGMMLPFTYREAYCVCQTTGVLAFAHCLTCLASSLFKFLVLSHHTHAHTCAPPTLLKKFALWREYGLHGWYVISNNLSLYHLKCRLFSHTTGTSHGTLIQCSCSGYVRFPLLSWNRLIGIFQGLYWMWASCLFIVLWPGRAHLLLCWWSFTSLTF